MAIETLLVNGKQYLYFCCWDSATKQKKRIYIGPATDTSWKKKARILERRYRSVRAAKERVLLHLGRLTMCQLLGDSDGVVRERLAITEELENMTTAAGL